MDHQSNAPAGPQQGARPAEQPAGSADRSEHPFYGNSFTNVGSADVPEAPEAIRSAPDKQTQSGRQLLDDDYYFG